METLFISDEMNYDKYGSTYFRKPIYGVHHQYSTRFSKNSFVENELVYSQTKYSVSSRGPRLWNKLLDQQQKSLERGTCFKKSTKLSLL